MAENVEQQMTELSEKETKKRDNEGENGLSLAPKLQPNETAAQELLTEQTNHTEQSEPEASVSEAVIEESNESQPTESVVKEELLFSKAKCLSMKCTIQSMSMVTDMITTGIGGLLN